MMVDLPWLFPISGAAKPSRFNVLFGVMPEENEMELKVGDKLKHIRPHEP